MAQSGIQKDTSRTDFGELGKVTEIGRFVDLSESGDSYIGNPKGSAFTAVKLGSCISLVRGSAFQNK